MLGKMRNLQHLDGQDNIAQNELDLPLILARLIPLAPQLQVHKISNASEA